ncbi:hypothetical protein BleG1_1195 [Shouchella lehensis G1]|uniref:Uncharacterized protein n=1 Tax=Shouchella lehensis G1 TaxID=1246626 RepID=A0A060LZR2_9BACI|nr:hypothetical protein BleG1_1195 [Shouchella lehensis G1]RQW22021.1 hypothetical protein EH196_05770 [Bacillus sp. C1-1]
MNTKRTIMLLLLALGPTLTMLSVTIELEWLARTVRVIGGVLFMNTIIFYREIRASLHKTLAKRKKTL